MWPPHFKFGTFLSGRVTFIYLVDYTMEIALMRLDGNKQKKNEK